MLEYEDRLSHDVKAAGPFFDVPDLPNLNASRFSG
jgi:hypothetical protein